MQTHGFQQHDRYAFGGGIGWKRDEEPLIGKGKFADGREYVVVLNSTGGCLMVQDDEVTNNEGGRDFKCPFPTQAAAMAFARGIGEPRELADFLVLGFC